MADSSDFAYRDPEAANAYGPSVGKIPPGADDDTVFKTFARHADVENDVRAMEKGMGRRVSPRYVVDDE